MLIRPWLTASYRAPWPRRCGVLRRCSFETALTSFGLEADSALEGIGRIVHEADLADERYDAPTAAGLDVLIRVLTLTSSSGHEL